MLGFLPEVDPKTKKKRVAVDLDVNALRVGMILRKTLLVYHPQI